MVSGKSRMGQPYIGAPVHPFGLIGKDVGQVTGGVNLAAQAVGT